MTATGNRGRLCKDTPTTEDCAIRGCKEAVGYTVWRCYPDLAWAQHCDGDKWHTQKRTEMPTRGPEGFRRGELGAAVWDREKRRHSSCVAQDTDADDGNHICNVTDSTVFTHFLSFLLFYFIENNRF